MFNYALNVHKCAGYMEIEPNTSYENHLPQYDCVRS